MNEADNLVWHRSSASSATGSDCVEVAELRGGGRAVRDSKNPDGPMLEFNVREWRAFLDGAKNGEFD